jgi:hypothetical protein
MLYDVQIFDSRNTFTYIKVEKSSFKSLETYAKKRSLKSQFPVIAEGLDGVWSKWENGEKTEWSTNAGF